METEMTELFPRVAGKAAAFALAALVIVALATPVLAVAARIVA